MSGKKVFIGLAVVGGGLYYYDQNVSPIFPRDKQAIAIPAETVDKIDSQTRDLSAQLKQKASDLADSVKAKTSSAVSAVKEKTDSTLTAVKEKTSAVKDSWSGKVDEYQKSVKQVVDEKPISTSLTEKYIDFVNKAALTKDTIQAQLTGSYDVAKARAVDEYVSAKKNFEDLTKEASEKGSALVGQAKAAQDRYLDNAKTQLQSAVTNLNKYGADLEKEADAKFQQVKIDAEKQKSAWFSWGSAKKDKIQALYESLKIDLTGSYDAAKARAVDDYVLAKKNVEDLTKQASEKGDALVGKAKAEQERYLENAKGYFENAVTNLNKYGAGLEKEADAKFQQLKADTKFEQLKADAEKEKKLWISWGSSKKDEVNQKAEYAKENAQAQYEALKKDLSDSFDAAKADAEKLKNLWLSWGSSKKDEVNQKTRDAKENAQEQFEQLKKDLSDSLDAAKADAEKKKSLWISWGSAKKDEADAKLEQAKADAEKEKQLLISWGSAKADEVNQKAQDAKGNAQAQYEALKKDLADSYEAAKADAEKKKNEWVSWGSAKADDVNQKAQAAKETAHAQYEALKKDLTDSYEAAKAHAVEEYNRAKKNFEDLTKQASEKADTLLGQAKEDQLRYLENAKEDLQSAVTNLKKYGADLVEQVTGERK